MALGYTTAVSVGAAYHMSRGIRRTYEAVDTIRNPRSTYIRTSYKEEAQALVKKIWYKNPSGKLECVDVSDISKISATRAEHSKKIVQMLSQKGIIMDGT